ncbi:polar amino acid transport system substrate-binding protein [Pseudobutyrivibrio sp. ACV-2]|uniref:ABC transporter substrate-binding protein/permease n=1 Tax=Pseudobutyrivibrio sp. ACV-2 TaxID=1520801 RepID=UPI000894C684|nr:ABC transporter substrate-binding protein/permease [Pseudobutyrivibrio sp. ACV-2]SEA98744.1 polar amino acid transport system substrate-binding protein [Pseudobutyrivibrio sp. ACV-2]
MKKKLSLLLLGLTTALMIGCGAKAESTGKQINSADDLEGAKIGVQLGTIGDIYVSDMEGDEAGTTVERYNKITDAVQALRQGKIDCVIVDEQPAIATTKDEKNLEILEEPFELEEYAICIAKDNNELLEKVNGALAELKEEGVIDQINANYIGDDTKGTCPYVSPEGIEYTGTLVVATNAAFPPYEYYEESKPVGIDMELIKAVGDKIGLQVKIEDIEFDSIINAVDSHKADVGIAGMTMTEERLKSINFSDPYTTSKQVIIVNNGAGAGNSLGFVDNFKRNFVDDNRWNYLFKGLINTLIIALCAVVAGVIIGFLVAIVRVTYDKTGSMVFLNAICKLYLTIIRGTPMMIQLLIIYYVVFKAVNVPKILVAIIAFAINSGAYVAEIMRGGIMSIDGGQMEAGRSLGLDYKQTMTSIILPQAVKNVLPALGNEFISLIKETSICGYIGLMDLTRGGDIIRSITYEAFLPLIAVALIYLIIVQVLNMGVGKLEKSLRKSEQ